VRIPFGGERDQSKSRKGRAQAERGSYDSLEKVTLPGERRRKHDPDFAKKKERRRAALK